MPADRPLRRGQCNTDVQVEFVDLFLGHKLVDVYGALALNRDRFELLGIELDIVALADLVPLDDVSGIYFIAGFRIDLAVLNAVASLLVQLMETDLLTVRCGRKQSNWT
jgi:hypothetical protein